MATRSTDITKLQRRVAALERKIAALEAELAHRGAFSQSASTVTPSDADERLWADLLANGIVRLPTPAELTLAAEWQALPAAEKKATRDKLRKLKVKPSLSEIIHKMRAGWYLDESEWASQP